MNKKPTFKKTSEYVAAGAMQTGWFEITVVKSTEKAVAVECKKYNSFGNDYKSMTWFPKSQVIVMENDFYTDTIGQKTTIAPGWLISAKQREGLEI